MTSITTLPAEMLAELSMRVGSPMEIVKKYGFDESDYLRFCTYPWFHKAVEQQAEKLQEIGFDFKSKMGMLAEDMLIDAYRAAKLSDSVQNKLDVGKYLAKVADLEPKANGLAQTGTGFSISITLPATSTTKAQTLELTANQEDTGEEDSSFEIDIGPRPDHIGVEFEPEIAA